LHVHHHSLWIRRVAASTNLPETAESGFHTQKLLPINRILAELLADDGTWTDETHLSAQHVEELRQLIETGAT